MHFSPNAPDLRQVQSLIHRLDAILVELDRARLSMPAVDVASAILKLQRYGQATPSVTAGPLRSTA